MALDCYALFHVLRVPVHPVANCFGALDVLLFFGLALLCGDKSLRQGYTAWTDLVTPATFNAVHQAERVQDIH